MAVKIKFDSSHNIISPTFVLAARNGHKYGVIPAVNISVSDTFNSNFELQFQVYKEDNGKNCRLWEDIVNFQLVWCPEWDVWFEIYVSIQDDNASVKDINCVSLGEAELSQINLYNIEINTEDDIAREDYEPTVLFNPEHPSASLLHRMMEKVPHYSVRHVDAGIAGIQRTFSFDGSSLYDAFQEVAEEINCIFVIDSGTADDGTIARAIHVYDLENRCLDCGYRGEFSVQCPKCRGKNILAGYGKDSGIFISKENLADNITLSTDTGSVKNCFRLEGGDDLMTATIIGCNPNGSQYLWYFSDAQRKMMSDALSEQLSQYDNTYTYYQEEYQPSLDTSLVQQYNSLINKYKTYDPDLEGIPETIQGYPALMEVYYNTIDMSLFLEASLMPAPEISDTSASQQAALLTAAALSPVAVQDLERCSESTASSAVLAMAKVLVDSRYQVKVKNGDLSGNVWSGSFTLTNYSDDMDFAESAVIRVTISDNYESYVRQKLEKALHKSSDDVTGIDALFKLSDTEFADEIKKYALEPLNTLHDACQSCLDILIEQGIADNQTWADTSPNLYQSLYIPYYNKALVLQSEIQVRENEIAVITGIYDNDGTLKTEGVQTRIQTERENIQSQLDIENFLGNSLWLELLSYRREDTYSNDNYISDGLDNGALFQRALEFIATAEKEIYKSATLQHSISATLKNLLVMKEFETLIDTFEVGSWIHIAIDGSVYKLRLISYQIDFNDLENLSVEFSDVKKVVNGITDSEDIFKQASSMASSYDSVKRQAGQGESSQQKLTEWIKRGLDLTNMKIIGGADNQTQMWDSHGMVFRKYDTVTDSYDDIQLKIINSTMAITDDCWKTVKTAVGSYYYYDPKTGKLSHGYGINAEILIGKLILGESLGIYSKDSSLTFDSDGLTITNGTNTFSVNPNTSKLLRISNKTEDILWVDTSGKLHIKGDGSGLDISANDTTKNLSSQITQNTNAITSEVTRAEQAESTLSSKITQTAESITSEVNKKVNDSDFGTKIVQNYSSVKIAWNNISNYIQFESGEMRIYENTTLQSSALLMKLSHNGAWYYYKGNTVGKIGTNAYKGYPDFRGLTFDLQYDAGYMSWSSQDEPNSLYVIRMVYLNQDHALGKKGLHLQCDTYLDSIFYINDGVRTIRYTDGSGGLYAPENTLNLMGQKVYLAGIRNDDSSFGFTCDGVNEKYSLGSSSSNSGKRLFDCYNNIDLHNYNILNQSDARMKTNISCTKINALEKISQIEFKEFDWIEDGTHEDIGVIAQQLQGILPGLVQEDPRTSKLSICENKFIPYILKAVQELYSLVESATPPQNRADISLLDISADESQSTWEDTFSLEEKQAFVKSLALKEPELPQEAIWKPIALPR